MKPISDDQIHAPAFQKVSDFIWSPNPNCDYVHSVIRYHNNNLKIFNKEIPPSSGSGIIFIGMCQLIEDCFDAMPREGSYIIVHRTNDRSFTPAMYKKKPQSVKHIYTVDCGVNEADVTAIPFGLASIGGEDEMVKQIVKEKIAPAATDIFCRYNTNPETHERIQWITKLQQYAFAKVVTDQIAADEFYREIRAHKFTMSLQGLGKDCARTYSAMILGSIPIVTDCIEMRHFEDMPLVYCPQEITKDWLMAQDVSGKSLNRVRMSYWLNEINKRRNLL